MAARYVYTRAAAIESQQVSSPDHNPATNNETSREMVADLQALGRVNNRPMREPETWHHYCRNETAILGPQTLCIRPLGPSAMIRVEYTRGGAEGWTLCKQRAGRWCCSTARSCRKQSFFSSLACSRLTLESLRDPLSFSPCNSTTSLTSSLPLPLQQLILRVTIAAPLSKPAFSRLPASRWDSFPSKHLYQGSQPTTPHLEHRRMRAIGAIDFFSSQST